MRLIFVFSLSFFALVGCTKKSSSLGRDLVAALDTQYKDANANNLHRHCDLDLKAQKYEVVRALEQRRGQIEKWSEAQGKGSFAKPPALEAMGRYQIYDSQVAVANSGWRLGGEFGWQRYIDDYNRIKNSDAPQGWLALNRNVRFLTSVEDQRILYWENMSLRHDDGPQIEALLSSVEDCVSHDCGYLPLPDDLKTWAEGKQFYKLYLRDLYSMKSSQIPQYLKNFERRLNGDHSRYVFMKNDLLAVEDGVLVVPVKPDNFGLARARFEDLTAGFWSQYNLKVRLEWRENDAMNILVDPIGSRAFVLFRDHVVHYPQIVGTRTISHEFGHVLGLKDNYWMQFNEDSCAYQEEYNQDDIMSMSTSGSVMPEHIQAIKTAYGL
jgi:hypothetical protein